MDEIRGNLKKIEKDLFLLESEKINKDIFDIAQGRHEIDVEPAESVKKVPTRIDRDDHIVKMSEQGTKDINREVVTIGIEEFPTRPPGLASNQPQPQEFLDSRRGNLFKKVREMFDDEIADERAGEVLSLLCAQTVLAPLEESALNRYYKKPGEPVTHVLGMHPDYNRKNSLTIEQDMVVFTYEMHYLARKFPPDPDADDENPPPTEHVTTTVEIRIPKRAILDKSMEQLTPEECVVRYDITREK